MNDENQNVGNMDTNGMNVNEFLSEVEEANKFQSNQKKINLQDYTYNPKPGTELDDSIRIVPPLDGKAFQRLFIHWNIGKSKLAVCPRQFNRPCPICEHIDEVLADAKKSEDDKNSTKRMNASPRNFLPVMIRSREHEGAKWWGFNKVALNTIAAIYKNPNFGDISHVDTGFDLSITSYQGNTNISILPGLKRPLADTPDKIHAIRQSVLPLSQVFLELPHKSLDKIIKRATGIMVEKGLPDSNTTGTHYGEE